MVKRMAAEFLGMFWLVLGGCGSAVLAAALPDVRIGLLAVSFAFGLTVRFALAHVTLVISTLIVALGASPGIAQTHVTSLEELRRELAAGDLITIVPAVGPPVSGQLIRLGIADLDLRPVSKGTRQGGGPRDITLPLDDIQSLERPRDSARNGAAIGAGIGAGLAGAMFVRAIVIDRNEIDEWAALYVGAAAVSSGLGALIGWALDAANSKPHIRYDASTGRRTKVSVQPVCSRGRGIALVVSFSR